MADAPVHRRRLLLVAALALAGSACSGTDERRQAAPAPAPRQPPTPRQATQPPAAPATGAQPLSYERTIALIAADIERRKRDFPQLVDFNAAKHCDRQALRISYAFRTHHSRSRGGWTAAVPNPDADGVWFHIDFHEPGSTAQIHTQPIVPRYTFRDKRVLLLILEGAKTKRLAATLVRILRDRGVEGP